MVQNKYYFQCFILTFCVKSNIIIILNHFKTGLKLRRADNLYKYCFKAQNIKNTQE